MYYNLVHIDLVRRRYVKYVLRWIRLSPERPLGPVKHVFGRFEFQSGKGSGNLPHMHMGIVLEDEPEKCTNRRISCFDEWMFGSKGRKYEGEGPCSSDSKQCW